MANDIQERRTAFETMSLSPFEAQLVRLSREYNWLTEGRIYLQIPCAVVHVGGHDASSSPHIMSYHLQKSDADYAASKEQGYVTEGELRIELPSGKTFQERKEEGLLQNIKSKLTQEELEALTKQLKSEVSASSPR